MHRIAERRRSSKCVRGRADRQGSADRSVHASRPPGQARRSAASVGARSARRRAAPRYPARIRRQPWRLGRAQGLAPVAARGVRRRPLHRGGADERHGPSRHRPWQEGEYHGPRPGCALSAGSRRPPVQGAGAEPALGFGFHLRRDLVRRPARASHRGRLHAELHVAARHRARTGGASMARWRTLAPIASSGGAPAEPPTRVSSSMR